MSQNAGRSAWVSQCRKECMGESVQDGVHPVSRLYIYRYIEYAYILSALTMSQLLWIVLSCKLMKILGQRFDKAILKTFIFQFAMQFCQDNKQTLSNINAYIKM